MRTKIKASALLLWFGWVLPATAQLPPPSKVITATVTPPGPVTAGQTVPLAAYEAPSWEWKAGDAWRVVVEAYSIGWAVAWSDLEIQEHHRAPQVAVRFSMEIRVSGSSIKNGAAIWQLDFVPGKDAPDALRKQRCRVWCDKQDKHIHKIVHVDGEEEREVPLEVYGGTSFLEYPVVGFPVQLLPGLSMNTADFKKENGRRLKFQRSIVENQQSLEARYGSDSPDGTIKHEIVVRQVSSPRANWWQTNETFVFGHLLTRAWLQSSPTTNIGAADPKKP